MKRVILSAVAALVLMGGALPAWAQMKEVVRKSGPTLIGTVERQDDVYKVVTAAGPITVPADQVTEIREHVSFEEEYARRLLELDADDVQGYYELALWCREEKQYRQARDELLTVLRLNGDHANARLMLQLVEEQLEDKPKARRRRAQQRQTLPGTKIPRDHLVREDDVYRIRLAELRSSDRVPIAFRNRADYRFVKKMSGSGRFADPRYERVFMAKSPVAKAVEMLNTPEAKELRGDILVRTDPRFMTTFKTRIWPMLARHCASADCHGGPRGAGRLRLYNARSRADELYFTNFLLLDAFESSRGRMIDRSHPARSLLLQFGLPADEARTAHPVPIKPLFRSTDDRQYKLFDEWIRMLVHPHPQYAIDYRVPGRPGRPQFAAESTASDADEKPPPAAEASPEKALP
ncbi:MAG: tetratricopeptide repeat protein [Planctomycetota bacterium]